MEEEGILTPEDGQEDELSPDRGSPMRSTDRSDVDFSDDNISLELETTEEEPSPDEMILPTPNELNADIDFSDNTTEI